MAPVYADHPFAPIPTPQHANNKNGLPSDLFDKLASEMAIVHNMMVFGLNAIYLQAPHVQPADEKNFLNFVRVWYELLHHHHTGEETDIFPTIEGMAGEKGIMEANVEQHHAFHDPLQAFADYYAACLAGKDKFDGAKVVRLIDAFGPVLMQHLADEIPTIQGLRRFGEDKMAGMPKNFDEQGEKTMKEVGLKDLTVIMSMINIHYEDDLWINWPPAPGPIKFLCRNIIWWFASGTTKFGPIDRVGKLRPLYAVPADAAKAL